MRVPSEVIPRTKPSSQGLDYLRPAVADLSPLFQGAQHLAAGIDLFAKEQKQVEDLKTQTDFTTWQTETLAGHEELKRNVDPVTTNFPLTAAEFRNKRKAEFMQQVPADRKAEYELRMAHFDQTLDGDATNFQYASYDNFSRAAIQELKTKYGVTVDKNPESIAAAKQEVYAGIDKGTLTVAEKVLQKKEVDLYLETVGLGSAGKTQQMMEKDPAAKVAFFEQRVTADVSRSDIEGVSNAFGSRLAGALQEAEAATSETAVIRDLYRPPERQAQARADFTSAPVTWGGKVYYPQRKGGIAAAPGRSRHQKGNAADINPGKTLTWLREHRDYVEQKYGLEFLKGDLDPGHLQLKTGISSGVGGINSFDALASRVEQAETGNGILLSPVGAAGVMQVMPQTAREIARELNDPNFPQGEYADDAHIQAYLIRNTETARAYGRHYLQKMLDRYGGDQEAALVAYNGGMKRADAWLAAGRDDSVIPNETVKYKEKVMGNLETPQRRDLMNDPRFMNVPVEDKIRILTAAETSVDSILNDQAVQTKKDEEAYVNDLAMRVHGGQPGEVELQDAIDSGKITDIKNVHQIEEEIDKFKNGTGLIQAIQESLANGETLDGGNTDVKKGLNMLYERGGGEAALEDKDAGMANALYTLAKSGQAIPTDAYGKLTSMTQSYDPMKAKYAWDTLMKLQDASPKGFDMVSNPDDQSNVRFWRTNSQYLGTEETLNRITGGKTAEDRAMNAKLKEEAKTHFTNTSDPNYISRDEIYNQMDVEWTNSFNVAVPQQQMLLETDFQSIYQGEWAKYRNRDQALAATKDVMLATWGRAQVGDDVFMKFPPDKFSVPVGGSYDWQDRQVREAFGLKLGTRYQLVTDPKTPQEAHDWKKGDPQTPGYRVIAWDANGTPQTARTAEGKDRIRFEATPADRELQARYEDYQQKQAIYDRARKGLASHVLLPPSMMDTTEVDQRAMELDEARKRFEEARPKGPVRPTWPTPRYDPSVKRFPR